MKQKQTYKNIFINILALIIQIVINMYLSPQIVGSLGTIAYGFIGLATDFISYASVIVTVFNSVASRFIANAYYEKEYDKANGYFNSLMVTNIVLSTILSLVAFGVIYNLEYILEISELLVNDVKMTFILIFISYVVTLMTMVFTTSTFVVNRTDLQGVRNVINHFVRLILTIFFITFVSIKIYWVALATLIANIITAIININLTRKLTPELKFEKKYVKGSYVYILAKSGFWMAFTSISNILLRGVDLVIANRLLGDYEMGLLSVARVIPNSVSVVVSTIAPIFTPVFLALYVKKDMGGIVQNVKKSINIMAAILFVPMAGLIVFSYDFYQLWQGSLNEKEIISVTILSGITVFQSFFDATTATMAQLSVVVNKLRLPVSISFLCGVLSIVLEIFLIEQTNLGVYSIVISTMVILVFRYVLFNPFYAAYCLKQEPRCFLITVFKNWILIPVLLIVMFIVRANVYIDSWFTLISAVLRAGILGYIIIGILYNRKQIFSYLKIRKENT